MRNTCVILVEDERFVAEALASCLEEFGWTVNWEFDSGETALAGIEHVHPDEVLMDIGLVGTMDGVETALQIREQFRIPVIFQMRRPWHARRSLNRRATLSNRSMNRH